MSRAAGVAAAGIVLTLAAFTFDAAPLFVPGAAFALLGLITPLWVWASARGADVQRRLVAERVIEGEPVEAMIEVRRGRLGLPGGEVLDPLAGGPVSLSQPLSLVVGGSRAEVRIVARMHRRGMHRMPPPSLVVHDTLELARVVQGRQRTAAGVADPAPDGARAVARERPGRADRERRVAVRSASRWPRWTSMGFVPIGPARPHPGSTGRRWPAALVCSSGGCNPTATPGPWSSLMRAEADRSSISMLPCVRRPRSPWSSPAVAAAGCCSPGSVEPSPSTPTWPAGLGCTRGWRWSKAVPEHGLRSWARALGWDPCSTWPRRPQNGYRRR